MLISKGWIICSYPEFEVHFRIERSTSLNFPKAINEKIIWTGKVGELIHLFNCLRRGSAIKAEKHFWVFVSGHFIFFNGEELNTRSSATMKYKEVSPNISVELIEIIKAIGLSEEVLYS